MMKWKSTFSIDKARSENMFLPSRDFLTNDQKIEYCIMMILNVTYQCTS